MSDRWPHVDHTSAPIALLAQIIMLWWPLQLPPDQHLPITAWLDHEGYFTLPESSLWEIRGIWMWPAWNGAPSFSFIVARWWSLTHLDTFFSTANSEVLFKLGTISLHVLHCSLKQASKELLSVSASVYYSACHHPCQAKPRETFFLEIPVFKGFLMSGWIYWGTA